MCCGVTKYAKGTIWWCNLSEDNMLSYMQKGRRPCLIISSSETNEIEHACTILPISTSEKYENYLHTHQVVKFNYNGTISYILCNMQRRISTFKLDRYYGTLSDELFKNVMDNYYHYISCDVNKNNSENIVEDIHSLINSFNNFMSFMCKPVTLNSNISTTDISDSTKNVNKSDNIDINKDSKIDAIKTVSDNTKTDKPDRLSTNISTESNANYKTNVHRGKDINLRRKSIFEQGYWQVKKNNIEFWNELLIGDIDSMIKKYKYKDRVDVSRRKYEVKKFLLKAGYTPEQLKTFIEI